MARGECKIPQNTFFDEKEIEDPYEQLWRWKTSIRRTLYLKTLLSVWCLMIEFGTLGNRGIALGSFDVIRMATAWVMFQWIWTYNTTLIFSVLSAVCTGLDLCVAIFLLTALDNNLKEFVSPSVDDEKVSHLQYPNLIEPLHIRKTTGLAYTTFAQHQSSSISSIRHIVIVLIAVPFVLRAVAGLVHCFQFHELRVCFRNFELWQTRDHTTEGEAFEALLEKTALSITNQEFEALMSKTLSKLVYDLHPYINSVKGPDATQNVNKSDKWARRLI